MLNEIMDGVEERIGKGMEERLGVERRGGERGWSMDNDEHMHGDGEWVRAGKEEVVREGDGGRDKDENGGKGEGWGGGKDGERDRGRGEVE